MLREMMAIFDYAYTMWVKKWHFWYSSFLLC